MRDAVPFLSDPESADMLERYCREVGISRTQFESLILVVKSHVAMGRRHGLFNDLEEILREVVQEEAMELQNVD